MLTPSEYDAHTARGYLDTGTYGLPPRSALAATEQAIRDWQEHAPWRGWEEDGEACRALFARLVGASAKQVALVPSVSVAAGLVAATLAERAPAGSNVVAYEQEFTSNLFPWLALEERGVEVRLRPLDELEDAVDGRTALVAISAVQSATGAVADLPALKATGVPLFIDATHAACAIPVDVDGIDYLAAAAYKWLLCPRGVAFFYVAPKRLNDVEPWTAGWKSRVRPYDDYYGPPRDLVPHARRLDVSLPWLLMPSARAALDLIVSLGAGEIAEHDLSLAGAFCAEAGLAEPASPIVRIEVDDADEAVRRLDAAGVACSARAGSVRLCFHLYNDSKDVALALEALAPAGIRA